MQLIGLAFALALEPTPPKQGSSRSSRNKGRCVMTPDPTQPSAVRDFCPHCREKFLPVVGWIAPALESALSPAPPEPIITPEDTLLRAGISNERQAPDHARARDVCA